MEANELKGFQSAFTGLVKLYCDNFRQLKKENKEGWGIVKGSVAMELLNDLYDSLTGHGVPTLEQLPEDVKRKYWDISGKHFSDMAKRIEMSKAAYIIDLITTDNEDNTG